MKKKQLQNNLDSENHMRSLKFYSSKSSSVIIRIPYTITLFYGQCPVSITNKSDSSYKSCVLVVFDFLRLRGRLS